MSTSILLRAMAVLGLLAGLITVAGADLRAAVAAVRDPQRVVDTQGADVLVLCLAQLVLVSLCVWCALCVVLLVAGTLRPSATLQWATARLAPSGGRRLIAAALGTGTLVLAACAPAASSASAPPSIRPAYAASSDAFDWSLAIPADPLTPSPAAPAAPADETPAPADSSRHTDQPTGHLGQHVVAPGECLWTIAEAHLGSAASTADVAYFVDQLYDLNQHLVGADPDLLPVGVSLTIPTP